MIATNRRRGGDRRTGDRRQRNIPVLIERRRGQDRRSGDRRVGDGRQRIAPVQAERRQFGQRQEQGLRTLYEQSSFHANRLSSELAGVQEDNPVSRLLVVQRFLLDHAPQLNNERLMRWARRLRDTSSNGTRQEMRWDVFSALNRDLVTTNRRGVSDPRLGERRQRILPVQIERWRRDDRRQQDLHALYLQSCHAADWLGSELAKVPADNPISMLLVLQRYLFDHRAGQNDTTLMKWARRLRETYSDRGRQQMRWTVFCALNLR